MNLKEERAAKIGIPLRKNEILLMRIGVDIGSFFIDVVLVYLLFILISFFINKLRNKKTLNS